MLSFDEVVSYTAVGGLKATFLTDFLHTAIALILIMYFTISVLVHPAVGGLGGLYDKVAATASENYITGNYQGSVLTFKSKGAIIWGLILKFGNLALVVMVSIYKNFQFGLSTTPSIMIRLKTYHSMKSALTYGSGHGFLAEELQFSN